MFPQYNQSMCQQEVGESRSQESYAELLSPFPDSTVYSFRLPLSKTTVPAELLKTSWVKASCWPHSRSHGLSHTLMVTPKPESPVQLQRLESNFLLPKQHSHLRNVWRANRLEHKIHIPQKLYFLLTTHTHTQKCHLRQKQTHPSAINYLRFLLQITGIFFKNIL